jgi:class 3 adenylate cyclase
MRSIAEPVAYSAEGREATVRINVRTFPEVSMALAIDEAALDRVLGDVEKARAWSPRLVSKLEALVRTPDEAGLVRINPVAFARERGVDPHEATDLFLHAAKVGLFQLEWHLLCPSCGMAVESFGSLRALHTHYYCELCAEAHDAQLDEFIQVSFTVSPRVRRLAYHDPDALDARDYLRIVRLTREAALPDGTRLADVILGWLSHIVRLAPGERRRLELDVGAGRIGCVALEGNVGYHLPVVDGSYGNAVALTVTARGVEHSVDAVAPGKLAIDIENQLASVCTFIVGFTPQAMFASPKAPTAFDPFLRGSELLTNQTFRQLFRTELIAGAEGIGIRDVTILFTDLKGSTRMYERVGDLKAFTRVRQHFDRLGAVIQQHGGAVVKTIGDAIMAAFSSPSDAVRAAVAMREAIDRFNRESEGHDIVLKIGLHRGASIAVTLNDSLDYFGQTVNIAARVQGLADADEIYLTDEVRRSQGVDAALVGVEVVAKDARLRGIENEVRVYRVGR